MKTICILFCSLSTILFSGFSFASTPENTASIIRNNISLQPYTTPSLKAKNERWFLEVNSDNRVIIPAGKSLQINTNTAQDISYHIVNYSIIKEARRMIMKSSYFIIE